MLLFFIGVPFASNFTPFFDTEYCLLGIGLSVTLATFFKEKVKVTFSSIDIVIGLLAIYTIAIFFVTSKSSVFILDFWIRIGVLMMFYTLRTLSNSIHFNKRIVWILFIHFVLEITTGILQYFDIIKSVSLNFKVTGTFSTPNYFGAYLSIGILILLWWAMKNLRVFKKQIYFVPFISILILTVSLLINTLSRSSWLGLVIGLAVLVLIKKKEIFYFKKIKTLAKLAVGLGLLIAFITFSYYAYNLKKDSANGRLFTAKIILTEIPKMPILGHGLFSFSGGYNSAKVSYFSEQERPWNEIKNGDYIYHAFNDYLEITYEIGLLGLGLFLLVIFLLIKKVNLSDDHAILGLSLLVSLLVFAFFSTPLTNEYLLVTIVLIVILCFSNAKNQRVYYINSNYLKGIFLITGLVISTYSFSRIQQRALLPQLMKNDFTEKQLKKLTTILSDNGYSNFFFAETVYHKFNRKKEALLLMEKAVNKNNAPKEIKKLANYYLMQQDFKKAEELFKFNVQNEPYRYEARMDLVNLYQNTNQLKKLKLLLEEVIGFPIKVPSKEVEEYKRRCKILLNQYSSKN